MRIKISKFDLHLFFTKLFVAFLFLLIAKNSSAHYNSNFSSYPSATCLPLNKTVTTKQNHTRKNLKSEPPKYLNYKNKGIPIGVELPTQKVSAATEITIPITFGNENNKVNGLYDIAFSLNIDTNYMDVKSIILDVEDSWLNNDNDKLLSQIKFNEFDSKLNVSLTKTNNKSISGFGTIANLRIVVMVEIEPEKRDKDFEIEIADVEISEKSTGFENIIDKGLQQIESNPVVVANLPKLDSVIDFQVYPTPTYNVLNININSANTTTVEVFNLIGTKVYSGNFKNYTSINTTMWPSSVYYLYLKNDDQIMQKKILVR